MINYKELRIGNYFKYGDKTFKVLGVLNEAILANSNRGNIDFSIENIEPIPLTEDWLLRFVFDKKDKVWSDKSISKGLFFKDRYFIENSRDGFLFCQMHYSGDSWFLKNIKYIHQLQNLYFALTGQELILQK